MTTRTLPPFPEFVGDVLGLDTDGRRAQLVIQRALDGLPFDAEGLALFQQYTGRTAPRPGGYPYGLILVGRQGGKTEQAAARLVYEAADAALAGERDVCCVGISQGHREAKAVLFGYVRRFFEAPLLRALVVEQTRDSITLESGVRVLVLPCRPEAIRGLRCRCVVLDEVAHFRSSANIPLDVEVWRAALATVLTTGGMVLAFTSPYAASGLAFDLHRAHYGHESDVMVWKSPSYVLHPGLDEAALERIREVDPEGAAAEIEGEFLRNVAALLDLAALDECVATGVRERPPAKGVDYKAHFDPSGGRRDAAALAIAHADGEHVVLDLLRAWPAPHSPAAVIAEAVELLGTYGVHAVQLDRYGGQFPSEQFDRLGVRASTSKLDTSAGYLEFLSLVQSARAVLLDSAELLRELRGLERRRGPTKDRVDHRPGQHDDRAAAAAGALVLAAARPQGEHGLLFDGYDDDEDKELEAEVEQLERDLGLRRKA